MPKSLEALLRDYQKRGYQWLKTLASFGFGGILADDTLTDEDIREILMI